MAGKFISGPGKMYIPYAHIPLAKNQPNASILVAREAGKCSFPVRPQDGLHIALSSVGKAGGPGRDCEGRQWVWGSTGLTAAGTDS